jgi:hypothetical protein
MMRLACCLATERGIEVCAPVHDALLICAPLERLEADVAATRAAMAEASRVVLSGFEIGTDAKLVAYPDRYMDGRGQVMWDRVCGLVAAEEYLVAPALVPELAGEFISMTLFTAINRQGVTFLLPVRLPTADGRQSEWHRSMREAAELAMGKWVRVKANMALGAYEMFIAESVIIEPVWPDVSFSEILRLAFRERVIDRLDHPVLKRLRGLA